jgi:hypothetical protein
MVFGSSVQNAGTQGEELLPGDPSGFSKPATSRQYAAS